MSDRFYSSQEVVSDGTLTQLMVTITFPEGTREDIHVFFNGVEDDDRWSWAAPNVNTIIFNSPVPEGETVLVRRLTQMDEVPHIFGEASGATGNSQFSYETIDQNFDFFKRATQDSMDSFALSGASAEQAKYWAQQAESANASAEGHRNSASASAASASVSALNAGQSATDAEQSAQAAEGFRDQAEVAKDQAEAAAQSAQVAEGNVEDLRDETLGYRNDAQSSASDAAGSASAAAGSASSASSSASLAGTHATNAQSSASDAANSASQAQTHESNASASAAASQTSRLASETARDESEAARDKAQQWAENPEDVPVEPGQYSAKHWAQKAEEFVGGDAFMRKDQNLSDVQDASMSRTNLGLGTAATKDTGTGPDEVPTNSDLGTAATRDVGTTSGTVAAGDDPRITGASQTLRENVKVTVGTGGDFPTINAAILYLSRLTPDLGVTAEVELMSGFVMEEQLFVEGLDLGWITITGVDAETVIDESRLTGVLITLSGDNHKPAFGVINGTLPTIGQLFSFSSKGSASDFRSGVMAYNIGVATILPGCGVKNAGFRGINAVRASTICAYGANVSGAGSLGIGAYFASTVNAAYAVASGAGSYGVVSGENSTIDALEADASGAGSYGIWAYWGSRINAQGANASGAGEYGIRTTSGSTVNAGSATGTLSQTANTVTSSGIIFQ